MKLIIASFVIDLLARQLINNNLLRQESHDKLVFSSDVVRMFISRSSYGLFLSTFFHVCRNEPETNVCTKFRPRTKLGSKEVI